MKDLTQEELEAPKRACTARERSLREVHSTLVGSLYPAIVLEEIRLLGVVAYKLDLELKSRKVS